MIWLGEVSSFLKMISMTSLKNFYVLVYEKKLYNLDNSDICLQFQNFNLIYLLANKTFKAIKEVYLIFTFLFR